MSHWQGKGTAPGYSRAVEQFSEAVKQAEKALREAMQREYPMDADVTVVRYRGRFEGKVVGHDHWVLVKNNKTGKSQKWWAAHVELTPKHEQQIPSQPSDRRRLPAR